MSDEILAEIMKRFLESARWTERQIVNNFEMIVDLPLSTEDEAAAIMAEARRKKAERNRD